MIAARRGLIQTVYDSPQNSIGYSYDTAFQTLTSTTLWNRTIDFKFTQEVHYLGGPQDPAIAGNAYVNWSKADCRDFSLRWSGYVVSPITGAIHFAAASDDGHCAGCPCTDEVAVL